MMLADFVAKIQERPELELVYSDPTMCIIRYTGPQGEREIRLGLWAVRRMQWERIVEAFGIPAFAGSSPVPPPPAPESRFGWRRPVRARPR